MPHAFFLLMDQYNQDPNYWTYSAVADTAAPLQALTCYADPPQGHLQRANCNILSTMAVQLPPCPFPEAPAVPGAIVEMTYA